MTEGQRESFKVQCFPAKKSERDKSPSFHKDNCVIRSEPGDKLAAFSRAEQERGILQPRGRTGQVMTGKAAWLARLKPAGAPCNLHHDEHDLHSHVPGA